MGERTSIAWNEGNTTEKISIACQGFVIHSNLFGGIIVRTVSSGLLFDIGIFLILYRFVRTLLKPLHMPFTSQLLAGFIVGPIFGIYVNDYAINRPSLFIISSVLANLGFYLQIFVLGVAINLGKLSKTDKKAFILSYSGLITSLAFSFAAYVKVSTTDQQFDGRVIPVIFSFNASNYLLSTSSHLNDLRISNSKLGKLASSTSMVTDMSIMFASIIVFNVIMPIMGGSKTALNSLIVLYYLLLFLFFRPLIIYLASFKKEGIPLKRTPFVMIVVLILLMAFLGETFGQTYSPFLVALTLPEEPLLTILDERLNAFTSNIFFPFFVISCGMPMALVGETPDFRLYRLVIILVMGYIGKFIGVIIPACFLRLPFSQATTLALIMSTRGVLDIPSILASFKTKGITPNHYTILVLQASITMGVLLPLIRLLYEPSRQYSTIMKRGAIEFQENNQVPLILVCIHKEESLPGLVRFLKAFYSTQQNPISILALQLLQQTGGCTMPIMAPLHEVSSISSLRSNIDRSTRIVNSFLHLERETDGKTRAQHYVAMSPYTTMHNDICNLAYEKAVGLVILPFHITSGPDGTIIDSCLGVREVNNMVLKKAPCSVGLLVERSSSRKRVIEEDAYMIWIVFIGGADDYEALAYGKLLANHPCVRLHVIWLKPPESDDVNVLDNDVMKQFRSSCTNNERISFEEVIVNSGDETIQVMAIVKEKVDLVVTGKAHNLQSVPLFGLSDGWCEYPELGVLGDVFALDFEFSLLVVQQEPPNELALDFEAKLHQ